MANPIMENLRQIRDMRTNKSFACTAREVAVPFDWRTAITPSATGHGGTDGHAGAKDWLAPRAIAATLIRVYDRTKGESFKTVMRDLELVINRGNELELTFVEEDGTAWLWEHVRLTKFDKKMAADQAVLCTIPLTFVAPDPRQRAQYQPGRLLLDNGLFLDDGWLLNVDPSTFDLSGAGVLHALDNTSGTAPDDAPIVTLQGPITGPIFVAYYDDAGNFTGWSYGGSVATGESLTVDAEQPEVVSSDAAKAPYPLFSPFAGQEGWGAVPPGAVTVHVNYTAASAPASCTIRWYPRK